MFGVLGRGGVALIFAAVFLTTAASAADWKVVQSSGQIWVGTGGAQKASLEQTSILSGGETLTTGADGRAMLVNGVQTMMVGPNAVVTVPENDGNGMATILQRSGEVTFDIDRQKIRHFAVETPYLAAVVKGTHFTVNVNFSGAAVAVERGLVQVTDLATGDVVDTPAGQTATVRGSDGRITVAGSGDLAVPQLGSPRAPMVARLSAEELASLQAAPADKTPGLIEVRGDAGQAGVGLAAVGAGGNGDDSSGGGAVAGSGGIGAANAGSAGPDILAQEQLALDAMRSRAAQFNQGNQKDAGPFAIALLIALSILVPLGFAYLKGRMG